MVNTVYKATYAAERRIQHFHGINHEVLFWPRTSRPKLLLLHGWMDCADTFQALVDALPTSYDIYAISWRGFGGSDWQTQGYYERMVLLQDLHQHLQLISPDAPLHICGHSMGSMLATHYASLFPQRVKSLIMAEGFGMPTLNDEQELHARMRRFIETTTPAPSHPLPSLEFVAQKLQKRNPNMTLDLALFMAQALTHCQNGQLHYRADPKHHLPQAHPYDWHRIAPLWKHLSMPVLWLQGENLPHNHYLARMGSLLQERQTMIPHLQDALTLAGAGHMLQWEAPQAFAAAINNFLGQIES